MIRNDKRDEYHLNTEASWTDRTVENKIHCTKHILTEEMTTMKGYNNTHCKSSFILKYYFTFLQSCHILTCFSPMSVVCFTKPPLSVNVQRINLPPFSPFLLSYSCSQTHAQTRKLTQTHKYTNIYHICLRRTLLPLLGSHHVHCMTLSSSICSIPMRPVDVDIRPSIASTSRRNFHSLSH